MRWLCRFLLAAALAAVALPAVADDSIVCDTQNKTLVCRLEISRLIQAASSLMTNGWENRIDINIKLQKNNDEGSEVIKTTELHATQRCYIDPFNSPCLVLWRGAKTWRSYRNEQTFLNAMSTLTIHVMKIQDITPDNYQVHADITVKSGSDHQQAAVKQWFRQSGGEDTRITDASLVGSFISAYMPDSIDMTSYTMSLDTTQFYIDPDFVAPPEATLTTPTEPQKPAPQLTPVPPQQSTADPAPDAETQAAPQSQPASSSENTEK